MAFVFPFHSGKYDTLQKPRKEKHMNNKHIEHTNRMAGIVSSRPISASGQWYQPRIHLLR